MIHEFRLLLRSRLALFSLLATALAVLVSLWLGWAEIAERRAEIARAQAMQSTQRAEYVRRYSETFPDAGDVAYYTFHVFPDPPPALAWLSLGNREVLPAVQRVRMLGLQSQIYDGEAHNPERAVAGTFDFGFAIVFLLPLLCIGLCHDLATQDREQGRSGLLSSLSGDRRGFWLRRVLARYALACCAAIAPLLLFAAFLAGWQRGLVHVAAAVALYAGVWTLLCAWLSLRRRASASTANAMMMLALWVATTLALPALANSMIALRWPMTQGGEIALHHRKVLNDAWDLPKEQTFRAFFRWHPEWRNTPPVTGRFHWKWYYAFHHVADRSVEPKVREAQAVMRARDRIAALIGLALPSVAMQNILDGAADNGNERLLAHRAAIGEFHDRLRLYFYPFVFEERAFTHADFEAMPVPQPASAMLRPAPFAWSGLLLMLVLVIAGLWRQTGRRGFA
jgi:ABC-2 type transport system permease protein